MPNGLQTKRVHRGTYFDAREHDIKQQAALEILGGKSLGVALGHARAEVARMNSDLFGGEKEAA